MTKRLFLLAAATALLAVPVAADNITVLPGYTTSNLSGIPPALGTCSTSNSLSDADDLVVCGKLEVDEATYHDDSVTFSDGTDAAIVDHVQETGLGGRLTVGLDETARTMVICDAGDMATDLGLAIEPSPAVRVFNAAANNSVKLGWDASGYGNIASTNRFYIDSNICGFKGTSFIRNESPLHRIYYTADTDTAGSVVQIGPSNAVLEFTDTDGEQTLLEVLPSINQSGTAAYNGINVVATETALGSGATGTGGTNNLLALGTALDEDMFRVKNDGSILQTVGALQVATEDVTCSDVTDTCAYTSGTVQHWLTAGTNAGADTLTVEACAAATSGKTQTFTLVGGTDDVVIDVPAGTDTTLNGGTNESVTYRCNGTATTWFIL